MQWLIQIGRAQLTSAVIEPVEQRRLLSATHDIVGIAPAAGGAAIDVSLKHSSDDGAGHDAGDDKGGADGGADDGAGHDVGDDHGSGGHGADD